jgi:Fic family protein
LKIKRPPKKIPVSEIRMESFVINFPLAKDLSAKGDYLHWDQLRHRLPSGTDEECVWSLLSMIRRADGQFLSLTGSNDAQHAFIKNTPLILQTSSMVDRLTTSGGEAELLEPLAAYQHLLDELRAEESISSSQLEGAATTSRVALEMIKVKRAPRDESEKMIMGNFHMMEYVNSHCTEEMSMEFLRKLHVIAVEGIDDEKYLPERFRQSNDVVVVDTENNVIHTPPDHTEINHRLILLLAWANTPHERLEGKNYLHPLVKACILHFMVGYLHPFYDGNGRTARAFFYWYMLRCGYSAFRHISVSKLLKKASTAYAKSYCYSETDDMDLTYFVEYQCSIVSRSLGEYVEYIHHMIKVRQELDSFLYESGLAAGLNSRQISLLNVAFARPGNIFTVAEVRERMAVSDNTARKDLSALEKLGLLKSHKDGKETVYVSPKTLPQLNKWNAQTAPRGSSW